MPIEIPANIPNRTKWCQICGEYTAAPCDVVELRRLLAAKGVSDAAVRFGQAHASCFQALKQEIDG